MLYIDALRANPNAQIRIDCGDPKLPLIKAFVMEDVAFGGRNSFNSALEAVMGGRAEQMRSAANAVMRGGIATSNYTLGTQMTDRTLSAGDSVSSWVSSDRPKLSIPMLFLAINADDDPRAVARDLVRFVYPDGNPDGILSAPLGYSADFASRGAGCCAIRIGNWFQTPRLFICKQLDMSISQRTDQNGVPLYVAARMGLESMRTCTSDEVRAFFLDGTGTPVAPLNPPGAFNGSIGDLLNRFADSIRSAF